MILESTVYEKLYRSQFPDLTLSAIYEVAFPATEISMRFLGELSSPISPLSETVLSFISCGITSSEELAYATGVDQDLLTTGLIELIENFHIVSDPTLSNFELTELGNNALSVLSTRVPIESEVTQTFDQVTRKFTTAEFFSNREIDSKSETVLVFPDTKSASVSATLLELRKLMNKVQISERSFLENEPRKIEISQVLGSKIKRKGQTIGKLLVWQDTSAQRVDFMIEIDQKRSKGHETELKKLGGIATLDIKPQPISKKEIESIKRITENPKPTDLDLENIRYIEDATQRMPDGGSVRPASHSQLLQKAIKNSKKRLLIVSPWLNSHVVTWQFMRDLENLLRRRNVEVTIAWGFDDATGKHSAKNNWGVTRKLLQLSKKYKNFRFLKLDQSHMKILVFDNNYVCTSHNWLSYAGNQPRMEWGELRTDPSVVSDRYNEILEVLPKVGHQVSDLDIPERTGANSKDPYRDNKGKKIHRN